MRTFRFPWVALAMSFTTAVADGPRPAVPTAQPFVSAVGAFIALSVPDLEASAAWYEAKLGLHRIMTVPRTGKIAGVVALEGGGVIVELIQHDEARTATPQPELTHGVAKAGVIVADFDGTVTALRARGVVFMSGPYPSRPEARANVMFRDNAGNVLQVLGPYAKR